MGKRLGSRKVSFAAALVVALIAAGGALAFYSSTGSGSGDASVVGSPADLTITASTPTTGLLYPGSSGEVDATISNPNTFPVRVNSLVLAAGGIAADSGHAACDTSALHYTTQTNSGSGWTIPAKVGTTEGSLDIQLAGAISMGNSAANECQGAAFSVNLATGP